MGDNAKMRVARIYLDNRLTKGGRVNLTGKSANHVKQVLRLGTGDMLRLFNGDGHDFTAQIESIDRNHVWVSIGDPVKVNSESPIRISLLQGICRGQRMDLLIQKATELGVHDIQPVVSDRVVVKLDDQRARKKIVHWQAIAIGASEQSGRAVVPEIKRPLPLASVCDLLDDETAKIFLDPSGQDRLSPSLGTAGKVAVLIGPEGGLSPTERETIKGAGYSCVSLGPRTLRTETAPIAAISIIQYLVGDLEKQSA